MTPYKTLYETALKLSNIIKDLPLHDRAAILGMVGQVLQAEARTMELTASRQVLNSQVNSAPPPITDEHYHAG